ncbi:hypothetical protein CI109_107340 [Kwoniella shandongensis]|uniref:Uncharacterized protein n=1 Tax=Kwoniella shandongensis TaxID=1734106 RepID=A0A5M6C004_9TREE|nr:uncharacterized protein CI109_004732 [Kwoniella shandongensis]KAA5526955.1 hypothetical protein CI109_004732 [Kwoniella shandongensis]
MASVATTTHPPFDIPSPSGPGIGGPSTTPTPNLSMSSPATPQQVETPHTVNLQTPGTTVMDRNGSSSSSSAERERERERMDLEEMYNPNPNGKGKGKSIARNIEEQDDTEEEVGGSGLVDLEAIRRMQNRVEEIERTGDDAGIQRDELLGMFKSLLPPVLDHLPFLQERLSAQKDTIATMQQQSKLSEKIMLVERQRHAAERDSWHAETRAIINQREAEIAAGTRQRKVLDLDVGYHQELEAANKRLEMDNKLMAPRLADTQRQIDKLVNELRLLRSNVVLNTQPLAMPVDSGPSHTPAMPLPQYMPQSERRKSRSPTKGGFGRTTMGDARTEHLLLAAKRVRTMRQADDRVGRLTLAELRKNGVVGPEGGLGYSEGYGGKAESDADEEESEDEEKIIPDRRPSMSVKGKGKIPASAQAPQGTPLLPRAKRSGKRPIQPPPFPETPSKVKTHIAPPTTPGGSNFNDLLRAAEMATRPGTPTPEDRSQHVPLSAMSATRSTTRVREDSMSDRGSPTKRPRRDGWTNGRDDDDHSLPMATQQSESQQSASALDLLAQASQLDVAQSGDMSSQSSGPHLSSAARLGGLLDGGSSPMNQTPEEGGGLGPAIDLTPLHRPAPPPIEDYQIDPSLSLETRPLETPKGRPRSFSNASELATPARGYASSTVYPTPGGENPFDEGTPKQESMAAYASPTGGTVPGLGKYVHLTSSMPARRVRSPYLKWTVEEDELLARAVAIHGEKWDLVSKGVPTRSYHQVRQRWLRKTGAFDKKPSESVHGSSGLAGEDDDTSPTPPSGKKRRKSQV